MGFDSVKMNNSSCSTIRRSNGVIDWSMKSFVWYGPAIREGNGIAYYQTLDVTEHQRTFRYTLGDNIYFHSSSKLPSNSSSYPSTSSPVPISFLRIGEIKSFSQRKCDDHKQVEIRWYYSLSLLREKEGQRVIEPKYDELRDVFLSDDTSIQPIGCILNKCEIRFIFHNKDTQNDGNEYGDRLWGSADSKGQNNSNNNRNNSSDCSNRIDGKGADTTSDQMSILNRRSYDIICRYRYESVRTEGGRELPIISKLSSSTSGSSSSSSSSRNRKNSYAYDASCSGYEQRASNNIVCNGAAVDSSKRMRGHELEETAASGTCSKLCHDGEEQRQKRKQRRRHKERGTKVQVQDQKSSIRDLERPKSPSKVSSPSPLPITLPVPTTADVPIPAPVPPSLDKVTSKGEEVQILAFNMLCDDVRLEVTFNISVASHVFIFQSTIPLKLMESV